MIQVVLLLSFVWFQFGWAMEAPSAYKEREKLARLHGLEIITMGGYHKFVNSDKTVMKAHATNHTIITISNMVIKRGDKDEVVLRFKKELAGQYKIHLMPTVQDCENVLELLIKEIQSNSAFAESLDSFKVLATMTVDDTLDKKQSAILPRIVVYPGNDKQHAQKALNTIYVLFKHKEGINIVPRYSKRVTSLISYVQGDGDHKDDDRFTQYYEQPDRVHYASHLTPEGADSGYHLKLPTK